uniref:Tail tube protein n=1 Tax=Siphoviridae sp. ctitf6 TaxID=2825627 RepID=A0A8S5P3R1_9CAUD|nr:MAG TPA: tail tube protein [Siphoviridae sp. ctitf6]
MEGYRPDNVISGTWGEVWMDDDYMAEVISFKAEVGIKYSDIPMARHLVNGKKMTNLELSGEVKFHKVSSAISSRISDSLKGGRTPAFKIISKLDDPDALGAERIVCYGCKFDKAILADWEVGKNGEESYSFSFEDWDFLDEI